MLGEVMLSVFAKAGHWAEHVCDGQLAWHGKVVEGVFRGPRRSLTIEAAGQRFHVECPATRRARIGEAVTVFAEPADAWVIGRE